MRVISRLNVGGPAIQAITLTARMTRLGYDTLLVHGQEGEREGNMGGLADHLGVRPRLVPSLRAQSGSATFVPYSASASDVSLSFRAGPRPRF